MSTNLLRNLIRPYLYTRYSLHRLTGTGAFGSDRAQGVASTAPPEWNRLKQAVWRYHVKQFHDSSCSVASVVSCLNAIRSLRENATPRIRQADILDQVNTGHWKERMSDNGYRGRRGLPLPLLGEVVRDSLAAYRISVKLIDVVQLPKKMPDRSPIRETLKQRLRDFERNGKGLVIAHFDQGALVPTLNIPHISPVGAYDVKNDRVTLLDVDPEQEAPYQVSFNRFCNGLSCDYHHVFQAFGYGSGGYVYIAIR